MIRDGQFLPEPPIKIGAGYDRCGRRDDYSPEEEDWQSVLLGYQPKRRRVLTGYEVAACIAGAFAALHALFWLVIR